MLGKKLFGVSGFRSNVQSSTFTTTFLLDNIYIVMSKSDDFLKSTGICISHK